jgi:hypothetical protein
MVSNSVKRSQQDVVAALERLRANHSDDPEYKNVRKELPKDWPI